MLVDTHAHLHSDAFKDDLNEVIERAKKVGVLYIIEAGLDLETNKKVLELAKKFSIIKPSLGVYPTDATKLTNEELESSLNFIRQNKDSIIAIGEVGLDFNEGRETEKQQREIFQKVINLAQEIKKPLIIHSRKAEEECVQMLESSTLKKVIFHCFNGNFKLVKRIENKNWFLSIPPIILRSLHFQGIVNNVSIENLLTETDSPYLAPPPKTRNEPAFVKLAVERIAEIKNLTFEETQNLIFKNFQNVFLKQF
ncbi:TatD family hydrolase [Candidatus Woesearchaeota archaeon]|nr:TatD family hydrolase [Candidatus Woesearchaeota archaeon]